MSPQWPLFIDSEQKVMVMFEEDIFEWVKTRELVQLDLGVSYICIPPLYSAQKRGKLLHNVVDADPHWFWSTGSGSRGGKMTHKNRIKWWNMFWSAGYSPWRLCPRDKNKLQFLIKCWIRIRIRIKANAVPQQTDIFFTHAECPPTKNFPPTWSRLAGFSEYKTVKDLKGQPGRANRGPIYFLTTQWYCTVSTVLNIKGQIILQTLDTPFFLLL